MTATSDGDCGLHLVRLVCHWDRFRIIGEWWIITNTSHTDFNPSMVLKLCDMIQFTNHRKRMGLKSFLLTCDGSFGWPLSPQDCPAVGITDVHYNIAIGHLLQVCNNIVTSVLPSRRNGLIEYNELINQIESNYEYGMLYGSGTVIYCMLVIHLLGLFDCKTLSFEEAEYQLFHLKEGGSVNAAGSRLIYSCVPLWQVLTLRFLVCQLCQVDSFRKELAGLVAH